MASPGELARTVRNGEPCPSRPGCAVMRHWTGWILAARHIRAVLRGGGIAERAGRDDAGLTAARIRATRRGARPGCHAPAALPARAGGQSPVPRLYPAGRYGSRQRRDRHRTWLAASLFWAALRR